MSIGALIVAVIMLASFALNLYNIETLGNAYYTAAVKSMLGSRSTFSPRRSRAAR